MRRRVKLIPSLICLLSLVLGISISYGAKMPRLGWKGPRVVGLETPREYKEGELLVKFKPGAKTRSVSASHTGLASEVKRRFARTGIEHIKLKAGLSMKEAIERYRKNPNVEYVEPNYRFHIHDILPDNFNVIPLDSHFDKLWGLHNTGQSGGKPDADIDAPKAWWTTTGSRQAIVAVIDTGVNHNHEDLRDNM